MSGDGTEEADGPPVKIVWVLKQPNDDEGKPKLQIQCGVVSCRKWHLFDAKKGEQYRNTAFVCDDVGVEHQKDFKRKRGESWDAWCEENEDLVIQVEADRVVGGAAAATGVEDTNAKNEDARAKYEAFLETFPETGDQWDKDQFWNAVNGLGAGNGVELKGQTITRVLKEFRDMKLYVPDELKKLTWGYWNATEKKKAELKTVVQGHWGKASLDQCRLVIKKVREPVAQKLKTLQASVAKEQNVAVAQVGLNTVALVAHVLCDSEAFNHIRKARGKPPQGLRAEAFNTGGIANLKAQQYKDVVEYAVENKAFYENNVSSLDVGDAYWDAVKDLDPRKSTLQSTAQGYREFMDIEKMLVVQVSTLRENMSASGKAKTGKVMFEDAWKNFQGATGSGPAATSVGAFYAFKLWDGHDLSFL